MQNYLYSTVLCICAYFWKYFKTLHQTECVSYTNAQGIMSWTQPPRFKKIINSGLTYKTQIILKHIWDTWLIFFLSVSILVCFHKWCFPNRHHIINTPKRCQELLNIIKCIVLVQNFLMVLWLICSNEVSNKVYIFKFLKYFLVS